MWVPITDITAKPKHSPVPVHISSPTSSNESPSKQTCVGVVQSDYKLGLEFNGVGGGESQSLGKVVDPHAPRDACEGVGRTPWIGTTAGCKSTVVVGVRICGGEGGHA